MPSWARRRPHHPESSRLNQKGSKRGTEGFFSPSLLQRAEKVTQPGRNARRKRAAGRRNARTMAALYHTAGGSRPFRKGSYRKRGGRRNENALGESKRGGPREIFHRKPARWPVEALPLPIGNEAPQIASEALPPPVAFSGSIPGVRLGRAALPINPLERPARVDDPAEKGEQDQDYCQRLPL